MYVCFAIAVALRLIHQNQSMCDKVARMLLVVFLCVVVFFLSSILRVIVDVGVVDVIDFLIQ